MSTQTPLLPSNLPDARTAQRLLDVIAGLEQSLRNVRHTAGAGTHEMQTRMANLQFENQRLRTTRAEAAGRLGTLIERLQEQLKTEATSQSVLATTLNSLTDPAEDEAA